MAEALTPTLEDLRDVPEAAWLWDGARARVAWANAAGIAYFGGQSLFDLIDRPFDFAEPGVETIVTLSRKLARGQVENALLHFPSSGQTAPLPCKCMVHALTDGRPGILAVASSTQEQQSELAKGDILTAFDVLPQAALLAGADGAVHHLNAAALLLLGAGQRASLAGLVGEEAAEDLLARTRMAGIVSVIRRLPVRLGERDIRLTLKRLQGSQAAALVLIEDITERRQLERNLAGPPAAPAAAPAAAPPLTASDADAFESLARALKEETAEPAAAATQEPDRETAKAEIIEPPPAPIRARPQRILRRAPHVPAVLRAPLDRKSEPMIIARNGQLMHANPAACSLLGFASLDELINDDHLTARFGQLGQSLPATDIDLDNGSVVTAAVQMSVIPWHGGPARQFVLRKAEPAQAKPFQETLTAVKPMSAIAAAAGTVAADEADTADDVRHPQGEPAVVPLSPESSPDPLSGVALQPTADIIALPVRSQPSEADAELRAILDTATDGIITLDAEACIHTFSAGAEAIFGYRIAEVEGKPFADLLDGSSRKVLRDYLAALQGPGLAAVFNDGREVIAVVKQGGSVPLFLTISQLQAPKSPAAFCAVVRDITQWKKTEAELRDAKEKAEATSRQKSEFLARISHELRTPLNAIMGFSEVMRLARFGEIENEKYRGYVNDIHSSGGHLLSLINDLLDLSKVEAGKLELNFTAVSLGEVIDHAVKLLQEPATAGRVILRKSYPAFLPNVVADLRSMRQIMLNLVGNAIKFTDPGGEVIISGQMAVGGELKLRVKDTGIGMNAEQLRDALEPFRRVTTDGREVEGTGLGLPLTKALTEANRAGFAMSSEPRKGTLVEITFPTTRVLAE